MKRTAALTAAVVVLAAGATPARAQGGGCTGTALNGAFAALQVGQTCFDLVQFLRVGDGGKGAVLRLTDQTFAGVLRINSLNAVFDPDPSIAFGASTSNLVAGATTYTFYFGTTIVPGFYTSAAGTAGVSVTSGAPSSPSSVAQDGSTPYVQGFGSNGPALTNLGVDVTGGPCASNGPTNVCSYGTTNNSFAPTFYDNLEVTLTYTQTGLNSQAGWTGRVDLLAGTTTVPEPATVALTLAGLAALAGVGVVRRRSA